MPLIYARQPCTTALRLLGVAAAEQPIEADQADRALSVLNSLLDSWSTDNLLSWTRPKIPLALLPGQNVYLWGTTPPCDIIGVPPVRLDLCLLDIGGTPVEDWQVTVLDQTQYETLIALKTMQSTYVEYVWLEDTQPVKRLHVWPIPQYPGYTLQLLPWPAQPHYTHWDEGLEWPNGYLRLMSYTLAVELAPEYAIEASPTVLRTAEQTKRDLAVVNARVGRLSLFPSGPPPTSGWATFIAGRAR
jgi:hypothetical protein